MGKTSAGKERNDRRVLVVEDDPRVRATAVDMFEDLGFRVYSAYNGADALRILKEKPGIRLVLADVRMPGMDGPELGREIARLGLGVKVVLTSGYVDADQISGFPFLSKPWRLDEVESVVASI